jgi:hypothetical protein
VEGAARERDEQVHAQGPGARALRKTPHAPAPIAHLKDELVVRSARRNRGGRRRRRLLVEHLTVLGDLSAKLGG